MQQDLAAVEEIKQVKSRNSVLSFGVHKDLRIQNRLTYFAGLEQRQRFLILKIAALPINIKIEKKGGLPVIMLYRIKLFL